MVNQARRRTTSAKIRNKRTRSEYRGPDKTCLTTRKKSKRKCTIVLFWWRQVMRFRCNSARDSLNTLSLSVSRHPPWWRYTIKLICSFKLFSKSNFIASKASCSSKNIAKSNRPDGCVELNFSQSTPAATARICRRAGCRLPPVFVDFSLPLPPRERGKKERRNEPRKGTVRIQKVLINPLWKKKHEMGIGSLRSRSH